MLRTLCWMTLGSLLTLAGAASAAPLDPAEVRAFFARFVALGDAHDVAVADLYADRASIRTVRRYAHGLERSIRMTGAQWKALLIQSMPLARAQGDRSTYDNIEVSVAGSLARIKADRYSVRKCYTDRGWYLIVERQEDGRYLIIEEFSETQPQSSC